MAEKKMGKARLVTLLLVVLLALQVCAAAPADDAQQLKLLPGQWTLTDEDQDESGQVETVLAILTLGEDGRMSFYCPGTGYVFEGAWAAAYMPDDLDRLILLFASTDSPEHAGSEYHVECTYGFYTESWVENDTGYTALILEDAGCSGVSPIEELLGFNGAALYRKQGPNMRVIKCRDYVSLRQTRSTSSTRLAKVPLGALVLAFPEEGEENGFISCVYRGEYGYILAEYLEPVE